MSSHRRLDISSLLCDNIVAPANSTRPDTLLSRSSPPQSPVLSQHQTQPTLVGSSYHAADVRSVLADTPRQYDSLQYEPVEHRRHQQPEEDEQMNRSDPYHDARRALPTPTTAALGALVLQPSPPPRRTPSPSYSPPPMNYGVPMRSGRHSDDFREADFPRLGSFTAQPQTHPHPYAHAQIPQPPSTSSANVREPIHSRRVSAQLSPHQYSPISFPHSSQSPSHLPGSFPPSARPLSVSPRDSAHSVRPSKSSSSERHLQRSPILSRHPDPTMHPSRRDSASLSPTVPTSGLSGLDVLVQAATEERERIDVHRRQSGGEEPRLSLSYASSATRASLSPVEHRGRELFHAPPPTPPYTASPQTINHNRIDSLDMSYGEVHGSTIQGRLSPEPSHQLNVSQAAQYNSRIGQPGVLRRRSRSPEAVYADYDYQPERTLQVPSSSSRDVLASKPSSQTVYAASTSTGTSFRRTSLNFESESKGPNGPVHHSRSVSPVEPTPIPYVRRSPPRSRPKPKKPGSAALALMEKELQEVALMDKSQKGCVVHHDTSSVARQPPKTSPRQVESERKPPDISSRSRQSNERGAADDEDVDDFFLSAAFDSPRPTERRVQSKNLSPITIPSTQTKLGYSGDRWSSSPSKHRGAVHSIRSPAKSGSSPERTKMSEQVPDTFGLDGEETMSEVEAEIFDELADAADVATSEGDRTDFDDQETGNMEIDVENELLSLIDGPSEPPSKSYHHYKPQTHQLQRITDSNRNLGYDGLSMPPPDVPKATGVQQKDIKKSATKSKARPRADDASKSAKEHQIHVGSTTAKSSKSKTGSKPRPTKGFPADKAKATKALKEPGPPSSASLSASFIPVPTSDTPVAEAFPMVTSSGRMVTKSKKSAAAAGTSVGLSNQAPGSHNRKRPGASGSRDRSGKDGSGSRSRSHSVMPRASVDPDSQREKSAKEDEERTKEKDVATEEADEVDKDRLYCICRTQYDEDRVMIACDRCDEWYHTQCVGMPDLLIDLVDQFICSKCIAQNPELNLGTTYKQRCFAGLKHPDPESPDACHKPSRGAYSKYCSDECGVRYMHSKIQAWASNGGDVRGLWESVKDAKRREGFVTWEPGRTVPKTVLAEIQNSSVPKPTGNNFEGSQAVAGEEGKNSIVMRLEEQLQTVVREREGLKKELEVLSWRERLLQLASDRAENVNECGWDQRLVYGDEEWLEFGAGVLESYEETAPNGHSEDSQNMDVDCQTDVGEWWCRGKKKCERHMGWQKIRAADMENERATKESALAELTTREREVRSRIEDILRPQSRPTGLLPEATFKFRLDNVLPDGPAKKSKKKAVPAM